MIRIHSRYIYVIFGILVSLSITGAGKSSSDSKVRRAESSIRANVPLSTLERQRSRPSRRTRWLPTQVR